MSVQSLPSLLSHNLRQPTWLALLASVWIHGLLVVLLPWLPLSARGDEPEIPRPVELIELSPAEQSRLPDFGDAQIPILPVPPNQPNSFTFEPLPNSLSRIPRVPPRPSFPTARIPRTSIPPLTLPSPQVFSVPIRPAVPRTPTPVPSPSPSPAPRESLAPFTGNTIPLDLQTPDLQLRDQGVPVDDLISRVPPISASPTPGGQPSPNASPTTRPDNESSASNNPAPSPTLTEEQQQLLAFNAEGMDDDAAQDTYAAWFGPLVEELGEDWNGENAPQIPLAAVYPETACVTRAEGVAVVGVLANDEGEVLEEPEPALIRSSGIPLFNQIALELAASSKLEATGEQQPYLLNIEFKYDAEACSAQPQAESETEN